MDRPGRTLLFLLGLASALAAYSLCGYVAFIVLPLLGGGAPSHRSALCLLPAVSLGAVLATAVWRGGRRLATQLIVSRRLGKRIEVAAIPHPPRLCAALEAAGLRDEVDLVDEGGVFSYVHGVLAPRIAISRGLLESLNDRELRAALRHEQYHVRHLDPLRGMIATAVSDGFFLLPYFGVLRARYEAERELAADLHSERACGRRALLGALVKALEGPYSGQRFGPSFAAPGLLDARVERLETGRNPQLFRLDVFTLASSIYGFVILGALFVLALFGMGGAEMLERVASAELQTSTGTLSLACLFPLIAVPAIALWRH
jgi:hypothetical protein